MKRISPRRIKKISLIVCVAVGVALGAAAVSIRAQNHRDAQAARRGDMKHAAGGDTTHPDCPMMQGSKSHTDCPATGGDESKASGEGEHDAHLAAAGERGAKAMGFSQTATTHHFILARDGGEIQVEVNDAADAENRDAVRQHLAHIARLFAEGDFNTPMLVHDRVPPGVARMQRLRTEITYAYEETDRGARVRIKTKSAEALAAVHEFLRFQIEDHQTGDSLEVNEQP